jgi:hypothetical protein
LVAERLGQFDDNHSGVAPSRQVRYDVCVALFGVGGRSVVVEGRMLDITAVYWRAANNDSSSSTSARH